MSGGAPILGPVLMGTLRTRDLAAAVTAYTKFMHAHICDSRNVTKAQAALWGTPELYGHTYAVLANDNGRPWLRIIEDENCHSQDNLKYTGWMALEVLVRDVDALAASLEDSPFEILRPVADLDVSDKIRAVQVRGPCAEILYLTQVKGEVPPFDLPMATCAVDRLFISVLCTLDRDVSLEFYENLSGVEGLKFETKITVLNQAYDYPLSKKHKVATVQFSGKTLVEIDQIDAALPSGHNTAGIFMVSFSIDGNSVCMNGPSGETIELIGNKSWPT